MGKTTQRRADPARSAKGSPRWLWIAGPVLAVGVVVGIYAFRQGGTTSGSDVRSNDPGVVHIHGLGINPANGDLYAATHMGVFQIEDGKATRVADRYQDTMGFTVVGPDHFIASGHPDLREELPPLLGLLESRDAGETWMKKSLLGKVDFHALRFSHGQIWGYDSTSSTLMVSEDGRRWDERSSLVMRDFVVSPKSEDVVLATNGEDLRRSEDGGRTWEASEAPDGSLLLGWEEESDLWLVTTEGEVYRSRDAGKTWDKRGGVDGQPEAFVAESDALYAATHGVIFTSGDEGKTWRLFYSDQGQKDEEAPSTGGTP